MQVPERSKGLALGANAEMRAGSNPVLHTLSIAQLVERQTVVVKKMKSVGRWFDSGC